MKVNSKKQQPTVVQILDDGRMNIDQIGSDWQVTSNKIFLEMVERNNFLVNQIEELENKISELQSKIESTVESNKILSTLSQNLINKIAFRLQK